MLALSRKKQESIMIGDDVRVTVLEIKGDRVVLGISAPKHIAVHREEVYSAVREWSKTEPATDLANR